MPVPPVQHLPLWILTPVLALALMAAHEAGVQLRRLIRARSKEKGEEDDAVGGHLGAALGLMGLLVGFTFGMSMERYNTRRALVTEEASEIRAHYRRLLAVPEPQRTEMAGDLIRYLHAREVFSEAQSDRELLAAETASEQAGHRLWLDTLEVADAPGAPGQAQAVLGTTDALIKTAAARRDALASNVPVNVVRAMLLYVLVAAAFMGYATKPGRRLFVPSTVQFVLLALAVALVLDLERAHGGVIAVDQGPLIRAAEYVRKSETLRRAPTATESSGGSRSTVREAD